MRRRKDVQVCVNLGFLLLADKAFRLLVIIIINSNNIIMKG